MLNTEKYCCTVTDYLDNSAASLPEKVAFRSGEESVTFSQFRENSLKVAAAFIRAGYYKKPVLVFIDKNITCLTAFMGAAYSGNFYTPVDPDTPVLRINSIIDALHPCAVIVERKNLSTAESFEGDADIFVFEDLMIELADMDLICKVKSKIIDTDALYVFFTSGSTGTPKGVVISHRSVIDYAEWVVDTFNITSDTVFGNQAPFYFDNSILDIFSTLKAGAAMDIIPPDNFKFPANLFNYLTDREINTIFWVPSALCAVANLRGLEMPHLPRLDKILFCGEVMPNKQLNMWRKKYPDALFANLYGPTEITDVCAFYVVDREFADDEPLPIGKPCRNTDILVLTEDNLPVKGDEIGELCVRGSSLSYGYYNNAEKTQIAFVQNPLNTCYPEQIYRTGDLVRYNEYGELVYISRKDFQIKHMGHRIELGEIETVACAIKDVESAVCLYDEKRSKIVMFYKGGVEKDSITNPLRDSLPKYMLPGRIIKLEDFPYNLNGKADRVKLKEML